MPLLLAGALILALLAAYLIEKRAEAADLKRFRPPGRLVSVGGRRLHLVCQGERRPGQPLVVLEAGHGDWSKCWRKVQPEIARFARACAYDRAGYGWSAPGPNPRTPLGLVHDLRELLRQAGEPGPYLLVGHSMGGSLSRLFATLYPDEVCGMVWVDTAHEDLLAFLPFGRKTITWLLALARLGPPAARLGFVRRLGRGLLLRGYPSASTPEEQAELAALCAPPRFIETLIAETYTLIDPAGWSRTSRWFGSLPVISIEAQYPRKPAPGYSERNWRAFKAGWKAMQDDLAGLSSRLRRIPAHTGHVIMDEQPELVVQAVRAILEEIA